MKAVVSKKGQVTIPKPLRDRLGIRAGQILEFETRGRLLVARKQPGRASPMDKLFGILPPMDVDREIDTMSGKPWNPKQDPPHTNRS